MRRFQESKQEHYPSDIWNNSTFSVRPRNTPGDEIFYGDGRPKRISSGSTRWTVMRTLRKLQNADLCSKNGHYLVMVDQFNGWPQVVAFPDENTTTHRLINAFRQFFTNVGAPVKIWTDNGWQFVAAEFQKFPEGLGHNARHVIPSLRTVELVSWNGGEDDEEVKCSGGNFRTPSQPIGERSPLNGRWKQTSSKKSEVSERPPK